MLKAEELRQLNPDEIQEKINDLKKESFGLRVEAKTGKLEKNHRIRAIKKDIARAMTIYNEVLRNPEAKSAAPKKDKKDEVAKKPKAEKTKTPKAPKKSLLGGKKKG